VRTRAVAALLLAAALLASCSSGNKHSSPSTTTTTAGITTTTQPPATTATTAPVATTGSTTTTAGTAACTTADLSVRGGQSQGAAGTIGVPVLFTNTGSRPCELQGYPGVAGLDANGHQLTQARRVPDGTSRPPSVQIGPGRTASALVTGSDVATGTATSCPTYAALLVTPPNDTHSVRVNARLPGCSDLQVHPVVPGSSGLP
jgi:hypothetical protein